ncbi:hypothetical protein DF186_15765, partial [Enterococcus hirae]
TFEDAPNQLVDLSTVFDDVDIVTNGDSLTFEVTSNSNPGLFDGVDVSGATLTLDLAFDQNGTATLEVTAKDTAGATATDTFVVNVAEVNDL